MNYKDFIIEKLLWSLGAVDYAGTVYKEMWQGIVIYQSELAVLILLMTMVGIRMRKVELGWITNISDGHRISTFIEKRKLTQKNRNDPYDNLPMTLGILMMVVAVVTIYNIAFYIL